MMFWIGQDRPVLIAGAIYSQQRELSCAANTLQR